MARHISPLQSRQKEVTVNPPLWLSTAILLILPAAAQAELYRYSQTSHC